MSGAVLTECTLRRYVNFIQPLFSALCALVKQSSPPGIRQGLPANTTTILLFHSNGETSPDVACSCAVSSHESLPKSTTELCRTKRGQFSVQFRASHSFFPLFPAKHKVRATGRRYSKNKKQAGILSGARASIDFVRWPPAHPFAAHYVAHCPQLCTSTAAMTA